MVFLLEIIKFRMILSKEMSPDIFRTGLIVALHFIEELKCHKFKEKIKRNWRKKCVGILL